MNKILLILLLLTSSVSNQQQTRRYVVDSNMSQMHNCEVSVYKNVKSSHNKKAVYTTYIKIKNIQDQAVFMWLTDDPIEQDSIRTVRNHFVKTRPNGMMSLYHLMVGNDYTTVWSYPQNFTQDLFFKELKSGEMFEFMITGNKKDLSEEMKVFFNKLRIFPTKKG